MGVGSERVAGSTGKEIDCVSNHRSVNGHGKGHPVEMKQRGTVLQDQNNWWGRPEDQAAWSSVGILCVCPGFSVLFFMPSPPS